MTICPELPQWLKNAEQLSVDLKHSLIPDYLLELLTHYKRAANRQYNSAELIAERYESGDLPCGASIIEAVIWHKYAAEIGSIKSALRLAKMYVWLKENLRDFSQKDMALKAISNYFKLSAASELDAGIALQAGLFLLEINAEDTDFTNVKKLVDDRRLTNHPDIEKIYKKINLEKYSDNNVKLCHTVINTKITVDADFKIGIYKNLETPLPLVGLPNPKIIKEILDKEFPWFSEINYQIYRQLVTRQYSTKQAFKLRPLLLAGAPGVGKTSWAKRLAEISSVPFRVLMAAGASDTMFLRGTPRGWSSARPGALPQTIASEKIANPIFLIDELDKASDDSKNGRIWDVLLQLLEPATSKIYLDECLQQPCDFSWVSWIATVNEIGTLPKPLLDRFNIHHVNAPSKNDFAQLIENIKINFAKELGIDNRMLPPLDRNDLESLMKCKNPRELGRVAQMIFETKITNFDCGSLLN